MTFYCITHDCADFSRVFGVITIWGDEGYIADCGGVAYMIARGKYEAVTKFGDDYTIYDILDEASLLYPTCDFNFERTVDVEV